jgi:chromosome segregation ATPase
MEAAKNEEITKLRAQLADRPAAPAVDPAEVESLRAANAELQGAVDAARAQSSDAATKIGELESAVASKQEELAAALAQTEEAKGHVAQLEASEASLKSLVDRLKTEAGAVVNNLKTEAHAAIQRALGERDAALAQVTAVRCPPGCSRAGVSGVELAHFVCAGAREVEEHNGGSCTTNERPEGAI